METLNPGQFLLVSASGEVVRKSVNYHPGVWGDYFISHDHSSSPVTQESNARMKERAEVLKEEVKHMFKDANAADLLKTMNLIDSLQLLGLDYLFEKEISEALSRIHDADINNCTGLYEVALWFRLLRQQGYNVSSDVFNKFKDEGGSFMSSLKGDVKGLLSLYNAAYLRVHGEAILDEAIPFTRRQLTSILSDLKPSALAAEVCLSLETPLHRRMRWVLARNYISIYQQQETRNSVVLELAKLNFNLLRSLHLKELKSISLWWKDLALLESLGFARDRPVECYLWVVGIQFEPQYSFSRMMTTKVTCFNTVLDDIFDVYSTLEEGRLLHDAIQRWDPKAVDELPEYLKDFYLKLLDTLEGFKDELPPEEHYRIFYYKEEIKELSRLYVEEAKWCAERHVPTLEEHLQISASSAGYPMLVRGYFAGMGDAVTKESYKWVHTSPLIIKAGAKICRILNDVASHELEQEREHVASTVQCYMKEHGTSVEVACEKLEEMMEDLWKDCNTEFLNINDAAAAATTAVPFANSLEFFHNIVRIFEYFYRNYNGGSKDGYTNSATRIKDDISLLLVQPLPIN